MPVPLRTNNLKVEAKFNVVTEFPNFDLHSAAAAGNIGLVEYALSRGQPVNSVLDGVLPLHAACAGGDEQVVKLLIDYGADVNAPRLPRKYSTGGTRDGSAPIVGTSGSTPLHFAAANGNKGIILTLLLRGAHPDRADKYGVTPEMLARRNGWIECAELLQTWLEKRDRDLRERQNPVDDSSANVSESRRLQVKRSIDTALNMLKASSPSLSDAYLKPPPSSTSASFSSQTPPASPNRGDYPPIASSSDDDRFTPSPSPIDLSTRRPSLPHIFPPSLPPAGPAPTISSSRSQKATLTKPASPRRPRSAGNGADREDSGYASYGRGGAGRLGSKYSLMNIFKKGETDSSSSHQTSSSLSIPILPSQTSTQSDIISTPPSHTSMRPRADSSNRSATPSSSQSPFKGLTSQDYSPSRPPPMPLAVELHNALAQHHTTRDRSGSSGSRTELANSLGINLEDAGVYGSPGSSPLTRFGLVTGKRQPRHSRDRSGSGASLAGTLSANRSGSFLEEVVDSSGKTKPPRSGILRGHQRSTSFGQGQANARALRFDPSNTSQSRGKDMPDRPPDSAPPAVGDFEIMEEDEEYGRPLSLTTDSVPSIETQDATPSSQFPFSINQPPINVDETDTPVTVKLQIPSPIDSRDRGDSVSSNSTGDSLFNPPRLSRSDSTSAGTGTVSTPVLSGGEMSCYSSPKDASKSLQEDEGIVHTDVECDKETVLPRRGNNVLDIDMSLIESHEEAEALVQRAQQDILNLAHCESPAQSSEGWTPLSARLAAYGESLALEKKLREQKEGRAKSAGEPATQPLLSPLSPRSKVTNGVSRQSSLDHRTPNSPVRTKGPRRPHTSGGTGSVSEGSMVPITTSVDPVVCPQQSSISAPVNKLPVEPSSEPRRTRARTPDDGGHFSRASSLDGHDTDSEFLLTRVSTAPSHLKNRRDQSRTKLTRMGFPTDVTARTASPIAATPPGKRFGLKSLMQSFKGKT